MNTKKLRSLLFDIIKRLYLYGLCTDYYSKSVNVDYEYFLGVVFIKTSSCYILKLFWPWLSTERGLFCTEPIPDSECERFELPLWNSSFLNNPTRKCINKVCKQIANELAMNSDYYNLALQLLQQF